MDPLVNPTIADFGIIPYGANLPPSLPSVMPANRPVIHKLGHLR